MIINVGDTCEFGGVTLGQTDTFGVEWYFTAMDGWGSPQSTVSPTQKAAGDGAFASLAFLRHRVITVNGAIVATSRPNLVAAFDRLQAAASINRQPVTITNGGAVRYINGQRQDEISVLAETDVYIEFSVTFLAADPRKFAAALTSSAPLPSGSGGLEVPFTVPFSIDSTIVTGACTLTNPGSAVGPIMARIDGPLFGPVITHQQTGLVVAFDDSYYLPAGSFLVIDMDAHTALENGTADRAAYLTSRGWFGFVPGVNVVAFSAASGTGTLTITAFPAWT